MSAAVYEATIHEEDEEESTVNTADDSTIDDPRPATAPNPYSLENRMVTQAADRSRCYPWSKYVKSQAPEFGAQQSHLKAPNFGISAGLDKSVVMWDFQIKDIHFTPNGKGQLRGHSNEVLCMDVTGASDTNTKRPIAVTAGWDDQLRVWDLAKGVPVKFIQGVHSEEVMGIRLIRAAAQGDNGDDVDTSSVRLTTRDNGGAAEGNGDDVANDDASTHFPPAVVTSSADGSVAVTDLSSGACVSRIEGAHQGGSAGGARCLDLEEDGRLAVTGGSRDKQVRLWDLETSQMIVAASSSSEVEGGGGGPLNASSSSSSESSRGGVTKKPPTPPTTRTNGAGGLSGHRGALTSVCLAEQGRRVLSSSHDGTVVLWDLVSGKRAREMRGHDGWVLSAAVAKPEGKIAVSGGEDRVVRLWDLGSGRCLETLAGAHGHWVSAVDVSSDGGCAMSGAKDGSVRLWDLRGSSGQAPSSVKLSAHRSAVNCCKLFRWDVPKPKGGPGPGD
jgi:WD40 repeat protein